MSTLAQDVIAMEEQLGVLLACRAIHAADKSIAAFEILLDNGSDDDATALSEFLAGSDIIRTYADVYQNRRMESVPLFLRVKPSVLLALQTPPRPARQYVLEVIAHENMPDGLAGKLDALKASGYQLALGGDMPDIPDPLLDHVGIVRLNLRRLDMQQVAALLPRLRERRLQVLVDGIDDEAAFAACREQGIDYFQGDFITTPAPAAGKRIPSNKLVLLELLAELQNPDTSPAALERIAIKDAALTYRILKGINSAAVGLNREIRSLSQAIALMGTNELKRWANLLLADSASDKPGELMRRMLVRGRMCEILAELSEQEDPINHFIIGLLSRLDTLMDIRMEELLRQLPLSRAAKGALLTREGAMGRILGEVENYEAGHFDQLQWLVEPQFYEVVYRHSVDWARQAQRALEAD